MKFGLENRRKLTGASLSLCVFQAVSILPALYIVAASGYTGLFAKGGPAQFLCALGFSAVPRAEAIGLSGLYRATSSESAVAAGLLLAALVFGVAGGRLLRAKNEKTAFASRVVYCVWLGADLLLRLLPLSFNHAFGAAAAICGFAVRLVCLGLVFADLIAYRRERANAPAGEPPK